MSSYPGFDSSALMKQFGRMNQFDNLTRSDTGFSTVLTTKHPEPYISIAAQALVQDNCRVHMGMVRKENKIKKWQDRYLVLHKGCLYYYKDSNDKKAQGQFSLSGYRLSKAPEKSKFDWVFKLTHIQPEKRDYFFAAHSEKELNEWIEKIQEDISEYCETRRPTGLHTDSSSEENEESYDYPMVAPEDFDRLREKLIKESGSIASIPSSSSELYCPPEEIFMPPGTGQKPLPSIPHIANAGQSCGITFHQKTVNISKVMGKGPVGGMNMISNQAAVDIAQILNSQPPKPPLRKRPNDQTPSSPQTRQKPALVPMPKPRKTTDTTVSALSRDSTLSEEDTYLELKNDQEEECVPRLSTLQRKRPDGNSFKAKDSEVSLDILPPSALRLDYNKTHAIPLLTGYDGAYMIHSSRKGDINQALSVCIGDKVKHFLIFCNDEQTEFGLDPKGPFFKSVDCMLKNYYEKPLPNQDRDAFLRIPYK